MLDKSRTDKSEKGTSTAPWQGHPRPQMKRDKYLILNGEWELDGDKIQVPFPPQSKLSGYGKRVGEELVYRKHFTVPAEYAQGRVLLHFGAVDQVCDVYLNGVKMYACEDKRRGGLNLGSVEELVTNECAEPKGVDKPKHTHEGGYLPFSIDITDVLRWEETAGEPTEALCRENRLVEPTEASCLKGAPLENLLEVRVTDTLSEKYPYGKQCKNRGGMWYTPVSGIWQSVWLENVPTEYIDKVTLTPDLEGVTIKVILGQKEAARGLPAVETEESTGAEPAVDMRAYAADRQTAPMWWEVIVTLGNGEEIRQTGFGEARNSGDGGCEEVVRISLAEHICADGTPYKPILWTPENPHLYSMKIRYGEDCVETYFALRTIDIREIAGVNRVCLNGTPIFLHGVLDQGYFPEGIYLPAEEAEYERDILRMKRLGFNMLRKHIKVEPECFYYYCDLHGMLVMQDMVNNGHYSYVPLTVLPTIGFKKRRDKGGLFRWERAAEGDKYNAKECLEEMYTETVEGLSQARKRIFREHTRDTITHLYNHPCIVAYTIFNEGWGQFDSDSLYEQAKTQDPTRLVDSTSGWFARKKNDFDSEHIYFRAKKLKPKTRPMFLSECGGFSLALEGHRWNPEKSYGYGACKSKEELTERILEMYRKMVLPAIEKGLCGCVYTQLSDVEDEINGLYTYDREVCKVVEERFKGLAEEIGNKVGKA